MLNPEQVSKVGYVVKECINDICFMRDPNNKIISQQEKTSTTPEEIAVIGKMLCEALNSMQDEVRFHAMRLPTKAESEELLGMVNKIVFMDTAPEDEFIKGERKHICPRCENEEIEEEHQFCMICGLKLK